MVQRAQRRIVLARLCLPQKQEHSWRGLEGCRQPPRSRRPAAAPPCRVLEPSTRCRVPQPANQSAPLRTNDARRDKQWIAKTARFRDRMQALQAGRAGLQRRDVQWMAKLERRRRNSEERGLDGGDPPVHGRDAAGSQQDSGFSCSFASRVGPSGGRTTIVPSATLVALVFGTGSGVKSVLWRFSCAKTALDGDELWGFESQKFAPPASDSSASKRWT